MVIWVAMLSAFSAVLVIVVICLVTTYCCKKQDGNDNEQAGASSTENIASTNEVTPFANFSRTFHGPFTDPKLTRIVSLLEPCS